MPQPGWYYRLSSFFKKEFGEKVLKIPLDAGLTCPNRDGTISTEGCIYCSNPSFSPAALARKGEESPRSIREQILRFQLRAERGQGVELSSLTAEVKRGDFIPARKYIAYFQSYTNTYAPLPLLRKLYAEALSVPGIVGLSIATRPDCLGEDVLKLLSGYAQDYHIWLELGLQSAHDRTLELINRGHTFSQFRDAVFKSSGQGIYICVHIINGLPGEGRGEMLETVEKINALPLNGIKFHQLQVLRGTPLVGLYLEGKVKTLALEEYLEILCDQLELLRRDIVVHRLLSEVISEELLIAPRWHVSRARFAQLVEKELKDRQSYQGIRCR